MPNDKVNISVDCCSYQCIAVLILDPCRGSSLGLTNPSRLILSTPMVPLLLLPFVRVPVLDSIMILGHSEMNGSRQKFSITWSRARIQDLQLHNRDLWPCKFRKPPTPESCEGSKHNITVTVKEVGHWQVYNGEKRKKCH